MAARVFAAVDIGASGGRVMAGVVEDGRIALHEVHRFANGCAPSDGHLRWDLTGLHEQILVGLAKVPQAESIGIDTWAVDYGLLDEDGKLLAEPIAYRDDRTAKAVEEVHAVIGPEELYAITGLQHLPFNTVFQLAAERQGPLWERAAHVVLLPDVIAFWLTGELRTEATNASTTGLVDVHTGDWSATILERLEIDPSLLPTIEASGAVRGTHGGVAVTTVGSHDTASAVAGTPMTDRRAAYVACGTWSLVGLELDAPVVTEASRAANFTNELGVDGRTRFLRNVGGLWLLQESMRTWAEAGETWSIGDLLAAAERVPSGTTFDVDDEAFLAPGDMPARIEAVLGTSALSPPQLTRIVLDSLAAGFASTVETAERLAGRSADAIHVVGGGSQNNLLCRLTASASQRPVVAGPVEATALGNVLVQARAHGALEGELEDLRAAIERSVELRRYEPE